MEFRDTLLKVSDHPVFIVGESPSRSAIPGTQNWGRGTRSSDFLRSSIEGAENVLLTNICSYQSVTPERLQSALKCLLWKIKQHRPLKIICLGTMAHREVLMMMLMRPKAHDLSLDIYYEQIKVVKLYHPSYVVRFNRDKEEYAKRLRKELGC